MVKMVTHIEVRCFQNIKLKNILENPSKPLRSQEIMIHQNYISFRAKYQYEQPNVSLEISKQTLSNDELTT